MTRDADAPQDSVAPDATPGTTARLAFAREFPLLGIPLRVRSNTRRAIELAAVDFSAWEALDRALVDRASCVEMRVVVHDASGSAGDGEVRPFAYRRHGPVFVGVCGSARLSIDLSQRLYVASVPSTWLERTEWYAWHVNGMARFAVSALDRQPFHAATWLVGGTAVMVCGPTGAGKSTLAYAALRQQFPLLAEEATHVALADGLRLWGHADRIALADDAVVRFPELAAWPADVRPNGKLKRAIPTARLQPVPPLTHRGPIVLCALSDRGSGPPRVERLSPAERMALLTAPPEEGFDQFPDVQRRLPDAFAGAPAFRLAAGADPDAAVLELARVARDASR